MHLLICCVSYIHIKQNMYVKLNRLKGIWVLTYIGKHFSSLTVVAS